LEKGLYPSSWWQPAAGGSTGLWNVSKFQPDYNSTSPQNTAILAISNVRMCPVSYVLKDILKTMELSYDVSWAGGTKNPTNPAN